MSRCPGYLQMAILDALATRRGGDILVDGCGRRAWLVDGTHDLRRVSQELASRSDRHGSAASWSAAYCRAVAGLVDRGAVNIVWLVPIDAAEVDFDMPATNIDGASYLLWFSPQRRFVGKRQDFLTLATTYASEAHTALIG